MRRTRPDGNCFFRAFAYAYLEYCVRHKDDYEEFRVLAQESRDKLVRLGFSKFTLEDFHDTVIFCCFFFAKPFVDLFCSSCVLIVYGGRATCCTNRSKSTKSN